MADPISADRPSGGASRAARGPLPLVVVLAVNAVALIGIRRYGWGTATTLALYWFENLIAAVFIVLRLLLHRYLTHDPGYEHNQLGISVNVNRGGEHLVQRFIPEFAVGAFVFTLAHGVFLFFLLSLLFSDEGRRPVDPEALRRGVWSVAAILALGFLLDLPKLRQRPFAWVRGIAQHAMSRVIVLHVTIVIGVFLAVALGKPEALLGVFVGLKLLADIASSWPQRESAQSTRQPPAWLRWVARRKGKDPQALWDEARRDMEPGNSEAGERSTRRHLPR